MKTFSIAHLTKPYKMSQPLEGKVAIITGGSKGIGRATAIRLARDGAKVVINYSSDTSAAEEVVKLIGADKSIAVKADAGNVAELEMLVAETIKRFGRIDVLVPNAGIMPMKDLESSTEADFDSTKYNISNSSGKNDGSLNSAPFVKDSRHNEGTVYVVSGSAGKLGGRQTTYPHNAMYFSDETHGGASLLEINGDRLDFKWICADGVIRDQFTILKKP